jgi:imidazolonepropionase-like amidohydrolase
MILAASDVGAGNSFTYPGESLHGELGHLADAGLWPLEALQTATVNPSKWMSLTAQFGKVASGWTADLLVLQTNPLDHVRNTQSLVAVIQDGRYLDASELARPRTLPKDQTTIPSIEHDSPAAPPPADR